MFVRPDGEISGLSDKMNVAEFLLSIHLIEKSLGLITRNSHHVLIFLLHFDSSCKTEPFRSLLSAIYVHERYHITTQPSRVTYLWSCGTGIGVFDLELSSEDSSDPPRAKNFYNCKVIMFITWFYLTCFINVKAYFIFVIRAHDVIWKILSVFARLPDSKNKVYLFVLLM